jgi:hypothetical protein
MSRTNRLFATLIFRDRETPASTISAACPDIASLACAQAQERRGHGVRVASLTLWRIIRSDEGLLTGLIGAESDRSTGMAGLVGVGGRRASSSAPS